MWKKKKFQVDSNDITFGLFGTCGSSLDMTGDKKLKGI